MSFPKEHIHKKRYTSEFIEKYYKHLLDEGFTKSDIVYFLFNDVDPIHRYCPVCGKELHFERRDSIPETCSKSCAMKYNNEKRENTCLKKYGVKNVSQSNFVKEKKKETCLKNYGVENPSQSSIISEKRKNTFIEKFGVDCPFKSEEIKNKIRTTVQKRYNVDNPAKSEIIKRNIRKTVFCRYGVDAPMQNSEIKEKKKQTCLNRYGVDHINKIPSIKEKGTKTVLKEFFNNVILGDSFEYVPLFSEDDYLGSSKIYKWKCKECGCEFEDELHPVCPECWKKLKKKSKPQFELFEFLEEILPNEKIIYDDRTTIKPLELDIVIPNLKIAFEFNGTYYHSVECGCSEFYHLNKTVECEKLGIRLFHVWQFEWENEKETIQEKIKNLFFKTKEPEIFVEIDRSWPEFLKEDLKDFVLIDETEPRLFSYQDKHFYDCGTLTYVRNY